LNTYDNYEDETLGIGYSMGALFSDPIFHKIAHSSFEKYTVSDAVEEYFTQATLIPPGKCRPDTRWDPKSDQEQTVCAIQINSKFNRTYLACKKHWQTVLNNRGSGRYLFVGFGTVKY
jgi:hypothetical protein